MTRRQIEAIATRFSDLGFRVSGTSTLRAVKGDVTTTLDKGGLCWSSRDLADVLAPAVPSILGMRKEAISLRSLCRQYFQAKRGRGETLLRVSPRLEYSTYWERLRATDSCALTPDEHAVYSLLLSRSVLDSEILTDYPTVGCAVRSIGRRQYYSCNIDGAEASATLRPLDGKRQRNSYLPEGSILSLSSLHVPASALKSTMNELGEWCYFTPRSSSRKL
jgi:hypothetical protein